jgi:hypothetical protein
MFDFNMQHSFSLFFNQGYQMRPASMKIMLDFMNENALHNSVITKIMMILMTTRSSEFYSLASLYEDYGDLRNQVLAELIVSDKLSQTSSKDRQL